MPVPLRTASHKAEAKYNVSTEFPNYGLHAAAATGNIGLVEYALAHGQPINSVLDGVLPLHAASAGGDEQVVKLLIDYGADVNAPRLPRRYSSEKNRDASVPRVGNSGATPLHFAAANGNITVARILLHRGAHPDRPDKHGITPENLARSEGWHECADLIKNWAFDKDKDLRDREGRIQGSGSSLPSRDRLESLGEQFHATGSRSPPSRKRLQVKRSIDNAFHILKGSASDAHLRPHNPSVSPSASRVNMRGGTAFHTPPASPTKCFGGYTFYPVSPPEESSEVDLFSRRPSLPQVFPILPPGGSPQEPQSTSPSPRRPNSANTDPDRGNELSRQPCRKLGSKYSLMNIFKKGQTSSFETEIWPQPSTMAIVSDPRYSLSSTTPSSSYTSGPKLSMDHFQSFSPTDSDIPLTSRTHSRSIFRSKNESEAGPSRARKTSGSLSQSPPQHISRMYPKNSVPSAVELHNALAQSRHGMPNSMQPPSPRVHHRHTRDRSLSGASKARTEQPNDGHSSCASAPSDIFPKTDHISPSPTGLSPLPRDTSRLEFERKDQSASQTCPNRTGISSHASYDDDILPPEIYPRATGMTAVNDVALPRPPGSGILKDHSRSLSGRDGRDALPGGNARFLRFDSLTDPSRPIEANLTGAILRASNSTTSLASGGNFDIAVEEGRSAPALVTEFDVSDQLPVVEDDEYEYGRLLTDPQQTNPSSLRPLDTDVPLPSRLRGLSFTSSSESSSSPAEPDSRAAGRPICAKLAAEFPFSIHQPPPSLYDAPPNESPLSPCNSDEKIVKITKRLGLSTISDARTRGDSVSSDSTGSSSRDPSISASGAADSAKESEVYFEEVDTQSPAAGNLVLPSSLAPSGPQGFGSRRTHTPIDINISSISTHAQAEALVQRAQRDILELENDVLDSSGLSADSGGGWTPLSARLAKYGESLALERKLREQAAKEQTKDSPSQSQEAQTGAKSRAASFMQESAARTANHGAATPWTVGVERQLSLEHKLGESKVRVKRKQPRRPHTSDGPSDASRTYDSFVTERGKTHQSSHSASLIDSRARGVSVDVDVESFIHPVHVDRIGLHSTILGSQQHNNSNGADETSRSGSLGTRGEGFCDQLNPSVSTSLKTRRGQPRDVARATKLTRMGFDAAAVRPQQPTKRFGGLKSLMQSFKGK